MIKRILATCAVAAMAITTATAPLRADPATVAATLSIMGKVTGALAKRPDRAAAYAVETYAAIEQTNRRLGAIESSLAEILKLLADTRRIEIAVADVLDRRAASTIEGLFREYQRAMIGDGRLDSQERRELTATLGGVNLNAYEMAKGDPMIVAPTLTLLPFLKLALAEDLTDVSEYSPQQAAFNRDRAVEDLRRLRDDPGGGPSLFRRLQQLMDVHRKSYEALPSPIRTGIDTAMARISERFLEFENNQPDLPSSDYPDLTETLTIEVWSQTTYRTETTRTLDASGCIVKSLPGQVLHSAAKCLEYSETQTSVFDGNTCRFHDLTVTFQSSTRIVLYQFGPGVERDCANQSKGAALNNNAGWTEREARAREELAHMMLDDEAMSLVSGMIENVDAAIAALETYDPDSVIRQLRAQARSDRASDLVSDMRATRSLASAQRYIRYMQRERDRMDTQLAASRARLEEVEAAARRASRYEQLQGLFEMASTAITAADRITTWLKESGYFEEPQTETDLPAPGDPPTGSLPPTTPPESYSTSDLLRLEYAALKDPKAILAKAEALVAKLRASPVGANMTRDEFMAVAMLQIFAGANGREVQSTLRAGSKPAGQAARQVWSKVPGVLRMVVTALAPQDVGTAEPYDEEHRRIIASDLMRVLGERETRRAEAQLTQ